MCSFNIFGACVSRDIFPSETEFEINQFISFTNPLSLYLKRNIEENDLCLMEDIFFEKLEWGSNFAKRCMRLDNNNCSLKYLAEKKSDWLLLDLADYRMDIIQYANNYFTVTNLYRKNKSFWDKYLIEQGGDTRLNIFNSGEKTSPFSQDDFLNSLNWFCGEITKLYDPNHIILHEYYMVEEYIKKEAGESGGTDFFTPAFNVRSTNLLLKQLYSRCEQLLGGCYKIPFPDNILANEKHKWGKHPLHYSNTYYEYAYKAIQLICGNNDQDVESVNQQIELLKLEYSQRAKEQYKLTIFDFYSKQLKKADKDLKRADFYCNTFFNVIKNHDEVLLHINNFCKRNNIKKCCFWGDYLISKVLAHLLKQIDQIELEYIICNWNHGTCDKVIPVSSETYPDTDALIICDVLNIDQKAKYCSAKTSQPIYSVFDFLPSK